MSKLPFVSPTSFTISAAAIGFFLIDDLKPTEQNALGNWFMLIGQVLCTNGSYTFHTGGKGYQNGSLNNIGNSYQNDINETVNMLKKTIEAIEKEIEQLKKHSF